MKTFEEKWTAWVDGELSAAERAEFEATLEDRTVAELEKNEAQKLGALLKEQLQPRAMGNEEFFHHQLRERIAAETATAAPERAAAGAGGSWWTIRRLLWTGATSLAAFAICTFFVMRDRPAPDQSQYLTQILNATVDPSVNPHATVSIFQTKQDKVTVLWVDGLKSLPADYAAK
ncbi:MAG: zf-HC2 domain-containing protein [Chthoniobacterales bacterium]|nr:zf-HC2 domain-containing protein [Chthoniobacterales bacterium]